MTHHQTQQLIHQKTSGIQVQKWGLRDLRDLMRGDTHLFHDLKALLHDRKRLGKTFQVACVVVSVLLLLYIGWLFILATQLVKALAE